MGFELPLTPIYENRNDTRQDLSGKRFRMRIDNFLERIKTRRIRSFSDIFRYFKR